MSFDLRENVPWIAPADKNTVKNDIALIGIHKIQNQSIEHGVRIEDIVSKVAIYVAAANTNLREQLESRRQDLIRFEESFKFDPARSDADFEILSAFLDQ